MRVDVDAFRGKWHAILPAFGIDKRFLSNRHGPCPICEDGTDRWRFDDRDGRGTWFCSRCGAGDGVKLVMLRQSLEFKDACSRIASVAGTAPIVIGKPKTAPQDQKSACKRLWQSSRPIVETDPCGLYLTRRIGVITIAKALRCVSGAFYDGEIPNRRPAMIAIVQAPDGSNATIHRTFLTEDGFKAPGHAPRRLMPGAFPPGSAIRLHPHTDALGVAEGIETALAANLLFGVPVWACLNAGNMEAFVPPPEVKRLVVFGDCDAKFRGQAAAYTLAYRRSSKDCQVEVRIPDRGDWADVLDAKRTAA